MMCLLCTILAACTHNTDAALKVTGQHWTIGDMKSDLDIGAGVVHMFSFKWLCAFGLPRELRKVIIDGECAHFCQAFKRLVLK